MGEKIRYEGEKFEKQARDGRRRIERLGEPVAGWPRVRETM